MMNLKSLLPRTVFSFALLIVFSQLAFAQNWQMAWQDEFNYTGLPDANKWGYDVGGGGWGNGEAQFYSNARQENSRVENGNLVIEARRDWSGAEYSSARLVSRNKGDWTYGKIEIRAKIPVGQGLWPAIWMLPTDQAYGGWPKSGEIDIMESFALGGIKYDKVEANIHTQAYNHTIGTNKGAAITGLSNIEQNFHVYTVTWTANRMVFDVDGKEYFTFNNEGTWEKWPYDKRFHLIMNIAVGGALGTWIDPNIFPKRMEVDYVRVYQDGPGTQPTTDVVTSYKDCNYGGFSGGLPIGDYTLAKLKALGIQDDDISSLRVAEGYQAILYQDDNFGGASTVINSDNTCLNTTWNDKVTSLKIIANGATNMQGAYFLQNRNSGLFMDIVGGEGSTVDGARVQQWNTAATHNQLFDFQHLGNGMYKITARHSGKVLDVDAAKRDNGAKVQQWANFDAVNQQFIVYPTGDGFYKLIPRFSGKLVEVAGASMAPEGLVQQWDNNNQTCGQWKFVAPTTGLVTAYKDCNYAGFSGGFGLGDYTKYQMGALGLKEDDISSLRITQGYKAILYQDDNFGGASTEITSDNTCLNTTWNDKVSSMRIVPNGVTTAAGTYFVKNRNSGLFMDVFGATSNDGDNIVQATFNGGQNQQFKFIHLTDGVYQILALHSNKSIDIDAIKTTDGANLQQWTYLGSANQQFIVVATGDGFYKIIPKHSGKVVEVAGAGMANGDNIQQWTNNNQTCGQWNFLHTNDAPVVSITTPVNNYTVNEPTSFTITATATDAETTVSKVEFFNGTAKLGEATASPYTFAWNNVTAGTYTITAKATNALSNSTTSAAIKVIVNKAPTVSITSPANNASVNVGATVIITTNAADADGTITKVEFYEGTTKLGEALTSPYAFAWSNVTSGTYKLTAVATDNTVGKTTSAIVTILVSQPTDINDLENPDHITIYPNPTTGTLTVGSGVETVEVFTVNGQSLVVFDTKNQSSIDISALQSGMYIFKITGAHGTHFEKIMKN